MKVLYFDTSAVIKEFSTKEVGFDLIDKLTTKAREGRLQIVSSVWAINEGLAVIDRKHKRKELTQPQIQTIMATFAQRVASSSESSSFRYVPIDHNIVSYSRGLIAQVHISPDDALHLYTCYVCNCQYFLVHDKTIANLKARGFPDFEIIDLGSKQDRDYLEIQLGI